jgi:hypothetical protein
MPYHCHRGSDIEAAGSMENPAFIVSEAMESGMHPSLVPNPPLKAKLGEKVDINGYVRDAMGNPVPGVKITKVGGDGGWTFTDETGYYLVGNNIPDLDYCLVPSKLGCTFDPASRCYTDLGQDHHNQDFVVTCE